MKVHFNDWNPEPIIGYKPKTTFYMDFSMSELDGEKGIKETYKRCFNEWKDNIEYLTELVMVLNWKIWEHHESNNKFAELYESLWEKADNYCVENLKGEDLSYFYRTTD